MPSCTSAVTRGTAEVHWHSWWGQRRSIAPEQTVCRVALRGRKRRKESLLTSWSVPVCRFLAARLGFGVGQSVAELLLPVRSGFGGRRLGWRRGRGAASQQQATKEANQHAAHQMSPGTVWAS